MKKIICAIIVFSLLITLITGCSTVKQGSEETTNAAQQSTAGNTTEAAKKEDITLKILIQASGSTFASKFQGTLVQQEMQKATGVTLDVIESDENKFNVILASGDLPDIIRVKNDIRTQLIEGKNIIPMDDLLQTNGQDILEAVPATVKYSRMNWSNGQNKLYLLPVSAGVPIEGNKDTAMFNVERGFFIRWDYYKELGYPEIKNEDDLLSILVEMVKNHSTTDDGQKVYGVSAFNDWGLWDYSRPMEAVYGIVGVENFLVGVKCATDEIISNATDLEGPFWKTVKFYYNANKLGIFDPDALTMSFTDYTAKFTAGRILYTVFNQADYNKEHAKDGQGFMAIPMDWGGAIR